MKEMMDTPGAVRRPSGDAERALLREMFDAGVAAVSADACLPAHLPPPAAGKTLVLAVGKAAAAMARVAFERMGGRVEGIALTRYGHGYPLAHLPAGLTLLEAGHPVPDEQGLAAARHILAAVRALGPDDQLLSLISGGGSALLALPAEGVTLADKQAVTRALLRCGASIAEINCVRKHLSAIKGGRLALAAAPAKVVTLAISDIPGDDPALVASGPTAADGTTLADARAILERYRVAVPQSVKAALDDPANETPDASAPGLAGSVARVVARSEDALDAAARRAQAAGYTPVQLGGDIEGNATEVGAAQAALACRHADKGGKWALLSGGETTVVVRNPNGRGGRNSEYLLSLALALNGRPGIHALACDTDGIDGTEANAGAVIDPTTLARAAALGLSPRDCLEANRPYDFFDRLGDLVVTGPTRTNVNDLRIILVDGSNDIG